MLKYLDCMHITKLQNPLWGFKTAAILSLLTHLQIFLLHHPPIPGSVLIGYNYPI